MDFGKYGIVTYSVTQSFGIIKVDKTSGNVKLTKKLDRETEDQYE